MGAVRDIAAEVAAGFGVSRAELLGDGRHGYVTRARFAAAWIARRRHGYSTPRIGRALNRDHSTILNAIRRCEELRASDPDYRKITDKLAGNASRCCPHCGGSLADAD